MTLETDVQKYLARNRNYMGVRPIPVPCKGEVKGVGGGESRIAEKLFPTR